MDRAALTVERWQRVLVCWWVFVLPLFADTGPLYVERLIDDRHIVVVTRAGESLLLERELGDDGQRTSQVRAGIHVFAVQRGSARYLLDDGPGRSMWVVARSLGWNPRTGPFYWILIFAGGVLLGPLVLVAWRWFDVATDSTITRYSHGPPPPLQAGELAARALPRGARMWMAGVTSAALGLLGVAAIVLLGVALLVAPGVVDPTKRPTTSVIAVDLAAMSVGVVAAVAILAGYVSSIRLLWWATSERLRFLLRPRTRTTAVRRHAGTVTTESGSDSSISRVHLLVYAFTAPYKGRDRTFVVGEVVPLPDELAVGPTLAIEYVIRRPTLVRRLG